MNPAIAHPSHSPFQRRLPVLVSVVVGICAIFALAGAAVLQPLTGVGAQAAAAIENGPLLVWMDDGVAPTAREDNVAGKLMLLLPGGGMQPVAEAPAMGEVRTCGENGISPDGTLRALFAGGTSGTLLLMRGEQVPLPLRETGALSCLAGGALRFSADGALLAYLIYTIDAAQREYAEGRLEVIQTASGLITWQQERVVAFDISAGQASAISFYANDRGEADEAAVTRWDGKQAREVATLNPTGNKCRFTSASLRTLADGRMLLVMGQRCSQGDGRTSWQLYLVEPDSGSAILAASDYQTGVYAPFTRTNQIFVAPDGKHAIFGTADGVTAYTAGLKATDADTLSVTEVLERQAVMPTLSGGTNAFPRSSPDGRWLALVVTSPNGDNRLAIWQVSEPALAPIAVEMGGRGRVISDMAFTPDSRRLVFISGEPAPGDNALRVVELSTGLESRIARGRFEPGLVISPDGEMTAVREWQMSADGKRALYTDLVAVALASGERRALVIGGQVTNGRVQGARFAVPLGWLTASAGS